MYLKWTSEFIRFIADQDHEVEDVLAHLVLRVLEPLEATSAFISILDNQNSLVTIGKFGIPSEVSNTHENRFSLSDSLPITDSIRHRKIVAINTLPDWPKEYSKILKEPYVSGNAAFIAFPIERSGTPVGVVAIFLQSKIAMTPEIEIFIQSIANLLALYLYAKNVRVIEPNGGNRFANLDQNSDRGSEISQRQLLILQLMAEGRTNVVISEMLKFSESTIRQETIKIFSKLGCGSREEASVIYREHYRQLDAAS